MSKDTLVYLDGEFVPSQDAKISVFDHGLLYGDGLFEGIRAYQGVVFQLEAHLDRLFKCAKILRLKIPLDRKQMREAILETLRQNEFFDAYIRLLVTRGKGDLSLDPRSCPIPTICIIAKHVEPMHGIQARKKGIHAIIASIRRNAPDSTTHEIKSLNYLNSILGKLEAIRQKADDAILLDNRGFVAEATGTTLIAVFNNQLHAPPLYASILDSITRRFVITLASELGYSVVERDLTAFQLCNADEVLLCGTLGELVPVVRINNELIGTGKVGPVFTKLYNAFTERRSNPTYGTPIYEKQIERKLKVM
jgi:branched-chain amino acid aminotransferase